MDATTGTDTAEAMRRRLVDATVLARHEGEFAGIPTTWLGGGDGPPLVLLHGAGENWAVWLGVLDSLAATHHVVAVDLPGHGDSLPVPGRLDEARVLSWLDELIDATCAEPPSIAGHLLGGAIAARYAARRPGRVAHLVLIDTLGLGWYRPALRFGLPMVRFLSHPTERSRDRFFAECFADVDRVASRFGARWDDLLGYALDRARQPASQSAVRSLVLRLGVRPVPADELDRITAPTTLVHGRHDLQVPLRLAQAASTRHGWPLHVIEDARDDPAAEQPARVVAVLRDVLGTDRAGHRTTSA